MNATRWERIKDIFAEAVELPRSQQTQFIERACATDPALLSEVRRMLQADQRAEAQLLDQPVLQWPVTATSEVEVETHEKQRARLPFAQIGYYRLTRRLGEPSGMGEVYEAEDERPQMGRRKVAVKLMQSQLSQKDHARFREEIAILAKLDHPNNIRLYECGEVDGRPYFVMEYFAGESLEARLARGPLQLTEVVTITDQVCEALHEAHQKGVVHRDLKPANIMLRQDGNKFIVKLLDYGIGVLEGEATKTYIEGTNQRGIVGTPPYLSPEQISGVGRRDLKAPTDIYSLGLVIYEMLTGKCAFQCGSMQEYLLCHLKVMPQAPSERSAHVPASLDEIVLRAIRKVPQERYQSARELAEELRRTVEKILRERTRPIPTPAPNPVPRPVPVPPPVPIWKRYWLPATAFLVLLAGGLGVNQYLAGRTTMRSPAPSGNTVNNTAGTAPNTAASPVAITSPTVAPLPALAKPQVTLRQNGVAAAVSLDKSFGKGDQVRLQITPAQAGYVYLVEHGTDGTVNLLYPMKDVMPGSEKAVTAQQIVEIPPTNIRAPNKPWFEFDGTAGDERLYLVFVTQAGISALQPLEQAAKQGRSRLSKSLLVELQKLADGPTQADVTVQRLVLKQNK